MGSDRAPYVLPKGAGRGIGSKLPDAALGALAAEGFERAYLGVLAANAPARAFYERRGFPLLERESVVEIAGERLREACHAKALGRAAAPTQSGRLWLVHAFRQVRGHLGEVAHDAHERVGGAV